MGSRMEVKKSPAGKKSRGISTEKSDAEGKSDASKEESRGFIGRGAETARRASEAILGKKTQQNRQALPTKQTK